MRGFLYGQTEYNILNNACHIEEYVAMAKEKGADFLSITDSNLHGHLKFYKLCQEANIKPIIGLEITLDYDYYKDTILAYPYNLEGYHNLLKIETLIKTDKLDFSKYLELSSGIITILVINKSILEREIQEGLADEAYRSLKNYLKLNNFYLGYSLQEPKFRAVNNQALSLAFDLGIKAVYIHELKYLKEEDKKVFETLRLIAGDNFNLEGDYSYFSPTPEFISLNQEVFLNTEELVNEINYKLLDTILPMPKYPLQNTSADSYLRSLATKGLVKRLHGNVPFNYSKRLEQELDVIIKMNFADYFLIVWDFILFAKKNDVLVGPGRGSAAGSLVAYSLGITEVDPLKYGLLFERFLNIERISMPDIDTDFPDDKRDLVINYVASLYGKKSVASITTFGTFSTKSSIRDLGRVMKVGEKRLLELAKLLNSEAEIDVLLANYAYQPDIYNFIYIASRLEGLPRNTSTHAAGIIVSDHPLSDYIPLQEGIGGLYQSELDNDDLSSLGLLKIDFLGLKNLTIIDNILKEINKDSKWLRTIDLEDKNVLNLLQKADTLGVFQLESRGIKEVLRKLKPTSFNDLVAVLALYRPGPMDNIDEFISRKHGKKFAYLHEDLRPILEETYGIIVYQEQIMEIVRKFGGYSLGEADVLRRAVSKKNEEILISERKKFIDRSMANNYSLEIASKIYDYIVKFANYGFNKSHSVAYALVSYQMAYLKAYYFPNFMANILNNVIGASTLTKNYIDYAKLHNLVVMPPDINISTNKYKFYHNKLYLPFNAINGIGQAYTNEIILEREKGSFKDFNDFKARLNPSEGVLEGLIFSGAFDSFGEKRSKLEAKKSRSDDIMDKYLKDKIEVDTELAPDLLEKLELKALGFNLLYDPLAKVCVLRQKYKMKSLAQIKGQAKAIVRLKTFKEYKTKNQSKVIRGIIYDDTYEGSFVLFTDFDIASLNLSESAIYGVNLNFKHNEKYGDSFIIESLKKLSEND